MAFEELIFILDKVGIIAFAFAGVSQGIQKKLDVFGLFVIGMSTAVAGGIIRDLMLSKVPYAVSNIDYLLFAFVASLVSIIIYKLKITMPAKPLMAADILGLGVFAAAGVVIAMGYNLSVLHVILFSIITAVGGGILRDILLLEIPFVLRKEVYATAAGVGAAASYLVYLLGYDLIAVTATCVVLTIAIRAYTVWKNFHLPVIR